MNELRSLALGVLPLFLLASSCTSSAPEASEPEGENASSTSLDEESLKNAVLVADIAEELDHVSIVGLAPEVNVEEIAAITTFDGHDVVFAVHQDDSGFYIIAPLNPAGPGTDGAIEFRITDGTVFGPTLTLALKGLPPAPGAAAAYAADMQTYVDDEAQAVGTTFEELQATSMEDTSGELFSLKIMQELVDDGTENDLTSALSPEESGLSADEMALLDSVIAKVHPRTQAQRIQRPRVGPATETSAADALVTAMATATLTPATVAVSSWANGCISDPLTISSADELVEALKIGVEAKARLGGSAGQLDRDISPYLDWGTLVPIVGAVSGGWGLVLSADIIQDKRLAGRYPSSLGELSVDVSEIEFNEDFTEPGTWSDVRVTAISEGYDSAADLLKFIADLATAPFAGAGTVSKKVGIGTLDTVADLSAKLFKNKGVLALQEQLGAVGNYCPHTWDVDVTGLPYTRGRSVRDQYDVDSENQSYSPRDTKSGHLSIEVDPVLFANQEASMVFALDTHKSRLELSPDRIEVRSPGEQVDIGITFSRSSTELASWVTEAGEFVLPEPETEGEVTRTLITPQSPSDYPFVVTATLSAETGLYALGPRVRLDDKVIITIAELLIDPPDASVMVGGHVQYTATNRRGEPVEVTWSTTGGAIGKDGSFTAGDEPGVYSVSARAVSSSEIEATVPVRVVKATCLLGRWSLRAEPFFAQISALAGSENGSARYVSGDYLITFDERSGFQAQRIAVLLEITYEGQLLMMQIDSTESGTYIVEDDLVTINETQSDAEVVARVPGVGAVSLPVNAPNGVSGAGHFVCENDVIEVTLDGVSATLDYLGPNSE